MEEKKMGCDIHIITQIKKDGRWQYVPEKPESLTKRNYFNFSILADVRNSFNTKGFEAKGLPDDLTEKKFGWKSRLESYREDYNTRSIRMCVLPDGSYLSDTSNEIKRYCSNEEYENWKGGCKGSGEGGCYVYDAAVVGGRFEEVPYNKIYTFEEYMNHFYEDEYNEELKDYGRYDVEFDSEDLHTPSWLSLKELKDFNYNDVCKDKCKVSKHFIDKFRELGGKLPKGMEIEEDFAPSDFIEALRQAVEPVVIIAWDNKKSMHEISFFEGIKELEDIAKQYNIENYEDIRIVFAFDN